MAGREVRATPVHSSQAEMTPVIISAWERVFGARPTLSQVAKAWAQIAIETGRGRYILNNNVGNIDWTPRCRFDYYLTHDDRSVNGDPAVREKYQTKRRAYPTLLDGVVDYLTLLKNRPAVLKTLMEKGSPKDFSHALAAVKYYDPFVRDDYTDKNGHRQHGYTTNLTNHYNNFIASYRRSLGPPTKSTTEQPNMPPRQQTDSQRASLAEPDPGGVADWFIRKLDGFVSRFASVEPTSSHTVVVASDNFPAGIEYARVLRQAFASELHLESDVYTDGTTVEVTVHSPFSKEESGVALTEMAGAVAGAFEQATQRYADMSVDATIRLNHISSLPPLTLHAADQAMRSFNLRILRGRHDV